MKSLYRRAAIQDIARGLRDLPLAGFLAWDDIRQRYVRTMLGPMWIVISTGVWFGVMGFVMGALFHRPLEEYLPFLVCGLLSWVLISTSVSESTQVLVAATPLIHSFNLPIFMHYIRFVLRNYIIFLHNAVILLIVLVLFPPPFSLSTWLVVPGLLLNMVILMSLAVLLSLANLRYRDTHLVVSSALQTLPFITPIFWDRGMLKTHAWIADLNPFYHMINVIRGPIIGHVPEMLSWEVTAVMAVGLFVVSCLAFIRYRHRIIFWL